MKTVRLRVHGRVQGVWYRGWTVERARAHGLDGWVRNRMDGTVEMALAGDDAAVQRMIQEAHEGPPAARVSRVEVAALQEPVEPGFRQLPTL